MKIKIVFCNLAYGEQWYDELRKQNPNHFCVFDAILRQLLVSKGEDISLLKLQEDLELRGQLELLNFKPIPANGQLFSHNGTGIRHVKYSKSKNIAVIWERIGETIFVTFDDHAPIRYHRAISFLRELRLGGAPMPKPARDRRRFTEKLYRFWGNRGKYRIKGVKPADRFYE
jgi:hypothetical protein